MIVVIDFLKYSWGPRQKAAQELMSYKEKPAARQRRRRWGSFTAGESNVRKKVTATA